MRQPEFPWKVGSWRDELAGALTSPDQLLDAVGLTRESVGLGAGKPDETHGFDLRVPRAWLKRIVPGDPDDPLLLQVLSRPEEGRPVRGYSKDPLGEQNQNPCILRKYSGRALLLTTSICPIHCRYCFRRHFPYAGSATLDQIRLLAGEDDLREVIFSGGDPLMLSDEALDRLFLAAEELPGLRRLRIHSRMPVVIPRRIDAAFLRMLGRRRLPLVMVLQINHPQEINEDLCIACKGLSSLGVSLLNQSVLLRGINDSLEIQVALAEKIFEIGVLPYYLHLLDRVQGASHFEVPETEARELYGEMAARLPGYLLPRLVREEAGADSKTLIFPL